MSLDLHDDHGQMVLAERSHDSAMAFVSKHVFKMEDKHKRHYCGDSGTRPERNGFFFLLLGCLGWLVFPFQSPSIVMAAPRAS
jgi:hypothetical protein